MLRATSGSASKDNESSPLAQSHHIQEGFLPERIVFKAFAGNGAIKKLSAVILMPTHHHVYARPFAHIHANIFVSAEKLPDSAVDIEASNLQNTSALEEARVLLLH
jgi:hypothetical protein